MLKLYNKKI